MFFILKILLAAVVIAFASWLSGKYPKLAWIYYCTTFSYNYRFSFFLYIEHKNLENTITFAKSVLVAVPVSYFLYHFFSQNL